MTVFSSEVVQDLVALEAGEPLELHRQDRVGLDPRQGDACSMQTRRPRPPRRGLAAADQLDDLVDVIEGDHEALDDVRAGLGLAELELRPPAHHLAPVLDEQPQALQQGQDLGPAVDEGQHDDAEGVLERRELVELVEDDLAGLALLDCRRTIRTAAAVALVVDVGDAVDPLVR